MVHIITRPREPSAAEKFAAAFMPAYERASQDYSDRLASQEQMKNARRQSLSLGLPEEVTDPRLQAELLKGMRKKQEQQDLLRLAGLDRQPSREREQGREDSNDLMGSQDDERQDLSNQLRESTQGRESRNALMGSRAGEEPELSDQQIQALEIARPGLGRTTADLQNKRYQKQLEERKFHSEKIKKYEEGIEELRERLPYKESAIRMINDAVLSGPQGLSLDYIAQVSGYEPLMSLKGAQLQAGVKEFLLSNIGRAGTRPNQWLEQQISGMLPKIGRSKEANLAVSEALKAETEMEKRKLQIYDDLSEKYEKELGYVPKNISRSVDQVLKPMWDLANEKLSYRIKELQESEDPDSLKQFKKVAPGTPLTLQKAKAFLDKYKGDEEKAEKAAKALGYSIPNPEVYER